MISSTRQHLNWALNFNLWRQRNFLCIQEMSNSSDFLPSERTAKELSDWTCISVLQWSESDAQAGCERHLATTLSTRLSSRSGNRESHAQAPYTRWQITAWLPESLMMLGSGVIDPEHVTAQHSIGPASCSLLHARVCGCANSTTPCQWAESRLSSALSNLRRCCCFKVTAAAPLSSCGQFHGVSHLQEEPWTSCSTENTWSKLRGAAEHTGTRGGTLAWGGDIQPRAWSSSTLERCWTGIFNCYHL
jgi:hypothetical protein